MVVPMSAPSTTAIACGSVLRLEAAKPTSITVTAVEDWMMVVTTAPEAKPTTRFEESANRMERSLSPATICRPSRASPRPCRKMARPPRRMVRSKKLTAAACSCDSSASLPPL
jgi:hypothetical protein